MSKSEVIKSAINLLPHVTPEFADLIVHEKNDDRRLSMMMKYISDLPADEGAQLMSGIIVFTQFAMNLTGNNG
jgi:hypothetical protein